MKFSRTVEHQMFEKVGEAGFAGLFVLGADVVPDVDGHDRGFPVFVDNQRQTVREDELLEGYIDLNLAGRLGKCRGGEQGAEG